MWRKFTKKIRPLGIFKFFLWIFKNLDFFLKNFQTLAVIKVAQTVWIGQRPPPLLGHCLSRNKLSYVMASLTQLMNEWVTKVFVVHPLLNWVCQKQSRSIAAYTRNNNKAKYYKSDKISIEKYWPAQIRNRIVAPLYSPDRRNTSCFHPWMLFYVSPCPDSWDRGSEGQSQQRQTEYSTWGWTWREYSTSKV